MKNDITLSPMLLLKRGVQVAVDCVNNPISNCKFSLLDFNSKTEHNSIWKTICNKIDYKVLLNTTYHQIKFFAAELSADITSDAVWATVRRPHAAAVLACSSLTVRQLNFTFNRLRTVIYNGKLFYI